MKPTSLERQIGGQHYKGLKVEPYQFVMQNDWDPLAFTILKRISRHRQKDGLKDVTKAMHEIDIRRDLWNENCTPRTPVFDRMKMQEYVVVNDLGEQEAVALYALEKWVANPSMMETCVAEMKRALDKLAAEYA